MFVAGVAEVLGQKRKLVLAWIHIAEAKGEGARSARAVASLRSPPSGGEEGTLAPCPRSHRERDRLECFGLS